MKRVLVISYYWPPAGSISVLRSLKIVKYLRQFGWEPVVYVPDNASYDYIDEANAKDIPEGIEIIRGKIIEPFNLFRKLSGRKRNDPLDNLLRVQNKKFSYIDKLGAFIRGNFFIPDARCLWIKPSVKLLTKYLAKHPVDAIFTDGPPHTNTMIGYHLSKNLGIPWLADFQDPWTQVDYLQDFPLTGWAWAKHRKMEQSVFKQASKITIASPSWKRDLEAIGAKNVDVIYYGYDEDDFIGLERKRKDDKFVIFHGGLLGYDRFPKALFDVLADKCKVDLHFKNKLKIKLAGKVDFRILDYINNIGLEQNVELLGFIPRSVVLQNLIDADLLLMPLNKSENAEGRLPGKLYEYMRSRTPILAFGPVKGDAANILIELNIGHTFEYTDTEGIRGYIQEFLTSFTKNWENASLRITDFSNYEQTRALARYLNEIA